MREMRRWKEMRRGREITTQKMKYKIFRLGY
jgi:hypothetical protein